MREDSLIQTSCAQNAGATRWLWRNRSRGAPQQQRYMWVREASKQVCRRMLTYADVRGRMLTYAEVC
jgi:hypothetical protein